jgi:Bacterial alpha-L-rhamnosidase 6 hairpin glycosidase domain
MKKYLLAISIFQPLIFILTTPCTAQKPIWKSKAFSLFRDSIIQQQRFVAKAISPTELYSDYQSPANNFISPRIVFKFSINGKDNEMPPGQDHQYNDLSSSGYAETPLIVFGKQYKDPSITPDNITLAPNTRLKIRLDLRPVLAELKDKGYFTTFRGDKIYKEDLKAVYVAGNTAPLIWDFDNLVNHTGLQLKDEDGDGIYETTLVMNVAEERPKTAPVWKLSKDISAFPQYKSDYPVTDAIYNLSLEEMQNAIEPDSTFRTGKEWAGVWTRDISYSIILSMAYLQPRVAKNSLLRKVNKKGKIIQDTGSGGAWPVSTDRMIWAVAAFELYKATGDRDWLQQAYRIIRNSVDDDIYNNIYDPETGLAKGESSFLDWREQTYPKWMQPADIYNSENLGTNAVHYQANMVLSRMATLLNDQASAVKYEGIADRIKKGINKYLWQPDKGYFGQYLYGRNYRILSPRAEALGEALTVLFDIADSSRQQDIIQHTPLTTFGISCIYPQIPGIPPYHNNAVWPFVQTYWLWAAAKTGNEKAVMESITDIYRPAAMFLTNKENFVADNGDFQGTQINSSNMLWSLSGNISIIYKIIFGIHFNTDGLLFQPFVPRALDGKRSLTNFTYRQATLNIELEGWGSQISSFMLDGKQVQKAFIPAELSGTHTIRILLANKNFKERMINEMDSATSPTMPSVVLSSGSLSWQPVANAKNYVILKNGSSVANRSQTTFLPAQTNGYASYQVIAVDKNGLSSFASEPTDFFGPGVEQVFELEKYSPKAELNYKGFTGDGFVEVSKTANPDITVPITVSQTGLYAIDLRYSNGNGPVNTENKCAIRTLFINGKFAGTLVMPQRGRDEWSNWGYSNSVKISLDKGLNKISILFKDYNENMNETVNQAMIDNLRLIRLK